MSSERIVEKAHSLTRKEMDEYIHYELEGQKVMEEIEKQNAVRNFRPIFLESKKPTPNQLPNRRNIGRLIK